MLGNVNMMATAETAITKTATLAKIAEQLVKTVSKEAVSALKVAADTTYPHRQAISSCAMEVASKMAAATEQGWVELGQVEKLQPVVNFLKKYAGGSLIVLQELIQCFKEVLNALYPTILVLEALVEALIGRAFSSSSMTVRAASVFLLAIIAYSLILPMILSLLVLAKVVGKLLRLLRRVIRYFGGHNTHA